MIAAMLHSLPLLGSTSVPAVVTAEVVEADESTKAPITDRAKLDFYITLVEDYLNAINNITAEFEQRDSNGHLSRGDFLMKRINGVFALKMDYRPPNGMVMLIKDNRVTHYSRELKEKTVTTTHSSPLAFLLDKKISLRKNTKVLSAAEENGFVIMTLYLASGDNEGAIQFVFRKELLQAKKPGAIEQWAIFKSKKHMDFNEATIVTLQNQKYLDISSKEFSKYY
jgi:outer membrane lipoprotein-sorting protein